MWISTPEFLFCQCFDRAAALGFVSSLKVSFCLDKGEILGTKALLLTSSPSDRSSKLGAFQRG